MLIGISFNIKNKAFRIFFIIYIFLNYKKRRKIIFSIVFQQDIVFQQKRIDHM
jgi:hypothetical protein